MAEVKIEQLMEATPEAAEQIAKLLPQLTDRHQGIDEARLRLVLATPGALYVAVADGKIVGMVQRVDVQHVVRQKCWIEDFVVDSAWRGQGIASNLLEVAIAGVPEDAASINLTSKVSRPDSHRLYVKLGFVLREEATLWRLTLPKQG